MIGFPELSAFSPCHSMYTVRESQSTGSHNRNANRRLLFSYILPFQTIFILLKEVEIVRVAREVEIKERTRLSRQAVRTMISAAFSEKVERLGASTMLARR